MAWVLQKIMKNFPAILMMKPMMKMNLLSDKQLWMPDTGVDKYLLLGPFQGHPSENSIPVCGTRKTSLSETKAREPIQNWIQ